MVSYSYNYRYLLPKINNYVIQIIWHKNNELTILVVEDDFLWICLELWTLQFRITTIILYDLSNFNRHTEGGERTCNSHTFCIEGEMLVVSIT